MITSIEISVETKKETEIIDITNEVVKFVEKSGVRNGFVSVHTMHTTTGIYVNENETGLKGDILDVLEKLVPKGAGYKHDNIDRNAHAHIRAVLLGHSRIFPVVDGKLKIGTWQSILFVEFDGPRKRRILIQLFGE